MGDTDQAGLTCSSGCAHPALPRSPAAQACCFPEMAQGLAQSFRWRPQPPLNFLPQGPAHPSNDHQGCLSKAGLGPGVPLSGPWQGGGPLTVGACLPRRLRGRVARALIVVQKSVTSESLLLYPLKPQPDLSSCLCCPGKSQPQFPLL